MPSPMLTAITTTSHDAANSASTAGVINSTTSNWSAAASSVMCHLPAASSLPNSKTTNRIVAFGASQRHISGGTPHSAKIDAGRILTASSSGGLQHAKAAFTAALKTINAANLNSPPLTSPKRKYSTHVMTARITKPRTQQLHAFERFVDEVLHVVDKVIRSTKPVNTMDTTKVATEAPLTMSTVRQFLLESVLAFAGCTDCLKSDCDDAVARSEQAELDSLFADAAISVADPFQTHSETVLRISRRDGTRQQLRRDGVAKNPVLRHPAQDHAAGSSDNSPTLLSDAISSRRVSMQLNTDSRRGSTAYTKPLVFVRSIRSAADGHTGPTSPPMQFPLATFMTHAEPSVSLCPSAEQRPVDACQCRTEHLNGGTKVATQAEGEVISNPSRGNFSQQSPSRSRSPALPSRHETSEGISLSLLKVEENPFVDAAPTNEALASISTVECIPTTHHVTTAEAGACLGQPEYPYADFLNDFPCDTVNQYALLDSIGKGAQAEVFSCLDLTTGVQRAIKVIPRPTQLLGAGAVGAARMNVGAARKFQQLQREVAIMKRCRHRNILALYEVIDDPEHDELYLVMQLAKGSLLTLSPTGEASAKFSVSDVIHYGQQLCSGLKYLHERGIVHRDIKPDNVLLGEDGTVLLGDFGVSRFQRLESPQAGLSVARGTPSFLAPECFTDEHVPSCRLDESIAEVEPLQHSFESEKMKDIWALGMTLYVMRYGKMPWSLCGTFDDLIEKVRSAPIPVDDSSLVDGSTPGRCRSNSLPFAEHQKSRLDAVILQMLSRDPLERITAADACRRFERLEGDLDREEISRIGGMV